MAIRDLGYRPYDGPRLPPSNATWVMLRYGAARIWASWLVRLAVLTCWFPLAGYGVGSLLAGMFEANIDPAQLEQSQGGMAVLVRFWLDESRVIASLFWAEMWFYVSLMTIGGGSSAIADDLTHRAFQFFFSKPVTPATYLIGRISALGIWLFAISYIPAVLLAVALAAYGPREDILQTLGLILPITVFAVVLAGVMSAASIGVSAMSKNRALTTSAWIAAFIVPHVVASVVDGVARATGNEAGWPWLYLASITALLETVRDALFKIDTESTLEWYHAAPVLALLTVGAVWAALTRLRRAEVIA